LGIDRSRMVQTQTVLLKKIIKSTKIDHAVRHSFYFYNYSMEINKDWKNLYFQSTRNSSKCIYITCLKYWWPAFSFFPSFLPSFLLYFAIFTLLVVGDITIWSYICEMCSWNIRMTLIPNICNFRSFSMISINPILVYRSIN
jgi:hypothetical protein